MACVKRGAAVPDGEQYYLPPFPVVDDYIIDQESAEWVARRNVIWAPILRKLLNKANSLINLITETSTDLPVPGDQATNTETVSISPSPAPGDTTSSDTFVPPALARAVAAAAALPSPPPPAAEYRDPFLAYHEDTLRAAGEERLRFDDAIDGGGATIVDCEVFRNCFVVCFKQGNKKASFELSERSSLNKEAIHKILRNNLIISFNGLAYDLPIIYLALSGAGCDRLKAASDLIVKGDLKRWQVEKELGISVPKINHIDLHEPNPSIRQGLKTLAGRLHARFLVDLPFDPDAWLAPEQINVVTLYCFNDIDVTELLYNAMRDPLALREELSKEYGIDLRSKSDAQVGEAIVKKRVEAALGQRLNAVPNAASTCHYTPPDFIRFNDERLQGIVRMLADAEFIIQNGKIKPPKELDNLQITIGQSTYNLGIGGIHSTEAHRAIHSSSDFVLIDADVASQYPAIIAKLGLYPETTGPAFLDVYRTIISERLEAKRIGNKTKSDGLKISINGIYGKLGSSHSFLYMPKLVLAVTLTGQLSILSLVEQAEESGIQIVSANTDGVLVYCPRNKETTFNDVLTAWSEQTGFSVETTKYKSIFNSSVNSYIALKEGGGHKIKGPLADPWSDKDQRIQMMKNPQMTILSQAVLAYVRDGTPLEDTIRACRDPRCFITIIKVTGGARWGNIKLGRVVRYYWAERGEPITYAENQHRVPKTEGAKPLVELTDQLPGDVDYKRYIAEAKKLAADLGVPGMTHSLLNWS